MWYRHVCVDVNLLSTYVQQWSNSCSCSCGCRTFFSLASWRYASVSSTTYYSFVGWAWCILCLFISKMGLATFWFMSQSGELFLLPNHDQINGVVDKVRSSFVEWNWKADERLRSTTLHERQYSLTFYVEWNEQPSPDGWLVCIIPYPKIISHHHFFW